MAESFVNDGDTGINDSGVDMEGSIFSTNVAVFVTLNGEAVVIKMLLSSKVEKS